MSGSGEIPAVITTAHLLLRGLIPAFVGCSIGICENNDNDDTGGDIVSGLRASAFQMTYRKDLPKLGANNGESVDGMYKFDTSMWVRCVIEHCCCLRITSFDSQADTLAN